MKTFSTLLKANLMSLFGSYGFSSSDNAAKPKKGKIILFIILGVYLAACSVFLTIILYDLLRPVGNAILIPVLLFVCSALLTFVITLFSAEGFLFKAKDTDMLFSMPISSASILITKIVVLYLYDSVFSFFVFGLGGITFIVLNGGGLMGILSVFFAILLVPVLPLTAAIILAYLIGIATRGLKYKNAIVTIITVILFSAIMILSMSTDYIDGFLVNNSTSIYKAMTVFYFPAGLFAASYLGDILALVLLIFTDLLPIVALMPILAKYYASIVASHNQSRIKSNYRLTKIEGQNIKISIFKKESKAIFSNSGYLINAFTGILIMLITAVTLATQDTSALVVDAQRNLNRYINLLPLIIAGSFAFCSTVATATSCSFSLEAKTLWIYKSSPIDAKTIFSGKILAATVPFIPFTVIIPVYFLLFGGLEFTTVMLIIALSLILLFATAENGLYLNLCYPKMDWTNEMMVIKQSTSVLLTMLIGLGVTILIIVLSVIAIISINISVNEVLLGALALSLIYYAIVDSLLYCRGIEKYETL